MKKNTQKKERKYFARDAFFPLREFFIKFPFTILHRFSQLREVELVGSGRNQIVKEATKNNIIEND